MSHYRSNVRDLEFQLFEVLGRDRVLGAGPYAELDPATAREILAEVDRLAREELAPSLADSDRHPPTFDPASHQVRLPVAFTASYAAYRDAEWWRLGLPEELGGTPCPPSLRWAVNELILGSNPAVHMYGCGPGFAALLHELGTDEQKQLAAHMVERGWGATMVLTEPDAGSDVGAGRTRAVRQPDGSWHLEGVKRFITSADHDLAENIVHLVLARPEGLDDEGRPLPQVPGTKGLSLFVVPKFLVDPVTGELGERNGVLVTNVEKKMGLKVSATCELTFGQDRPAVGTLLGDVHDGIAQMFRVIEDARMMVGTKAMATLSTGYLTAVDFARTRVQGADLTQMTNKAAPRVPILQHPEVRRSLLTQKAYAEGLRALVLFTATALDDAQAGGDPRRADLLLPLVKGYGSEKAFEQLAQSLQILGGSGYLQDYPLEQYLRDAKIDTLYEGTTAIQALDFFFRKIVRDQGATLSGLAAEIAEFAKGEAGNGTLATERDLLGVALEDAQGILAVMVGSLAANRAEPSAVYTAGENATRLLMAAGDLVVAWLLLRGADVAIQALERDPGDRDRTFYEGKIAAAKFFARSVLPLLTAQRAVAERGGDQVMGLSAEAF